MDNLHDTLEKLKHGEISIEEAETALREEPIADLGYANIDLHRKMRQGMAEVIYGAGKTSEQIAGILTTMRAHHQGTILVTRLDAEKYENVCQALQFGAAPSGNMDAITSGKAISNRYSEGEMAVSPPVDTTKDMGTITSTDNSTEEGRAEINPADLHYHKDARILVVGDMPTRKYKANLVVATGGTSDIPVAEEAALTAEAAGVRVKRLYDVGVAGLHRVLSHLDDIMEADVIITCAGMEGALASVIGGLADCPVIAVPTSVGYGASFHGLSALLSMLNSCASGVTVVNIDNGFGAAMAAMKMIRMAEKQEKE